MNTRILIFFLLFPYTVKSQVGTISTYAGNGIAGYSGDGGNCLSASFNTPQYIAFDNYGDLFVVDRLNHVIRKINNLGVITTVVGNGTAGYTGDGGLAANAQLRDPTCITFDIANNLYITDAGNHVIRKVSSSGIIITIAGTGLIGYTGDGGPANIAKLTAPYGIVIDNMGTIYFSQPNNYCVRKITPSGIISTIAGNGTGGFSGDGGPATMAQLKTPGYIAINSVGDIFIPDWMNHRIRKINTTGVISTIAGNGIIGSSGDGGLATAAELNAPNAIKIDDDGSFIIVDAYENILRKVNSSGIITTIAGSGTAGYNGDGSIATLAQLNNPTCIAINASGNAFIADQNNNRIRKITYSPDVVSELDKFPIDTEIYPNPTHNNLNIAVDVVISNVAIVNILGQMVQETLITSNTKEVTLNISALPRGLYSVKINGVYSGRVVKE